MVLQPNNKFPWNQFSGIAEKKFETWKRKQRDQDLSEIQRKAKKKKKALIGAKLTPLGKKGRRKKRVLKAFKKKGKKKGE